VTITCPGNWESLNLFLNLIKTRHLLVIENLSTVLPLPFSSRLKIKKTKQCSMQGVVHICNPALRRLQQENHKFEASLGYIARPHLKQTNKQHINVNWLVHWDNWLGECSQAHAWGMSGRWPPDCHPQILPLTQMWWECHFVCQEAGTR
jgi:hypothetical protein